jgi:DNA-binding PadR family transcriptional regulator
MSYDDQSDRTDIQTRYILLSMLQDSLSRLTIPEISEKLILRNEDVFVILNRLEAVNWVEFTVETDDSDADKPHKKRVYYLTEGGAQEARALLRQVNTNDFAELASSLGLRLDVLDEPRGDGER